MIRKHSGSWAQDPTFYFWIDFDRRPLNRFLSIPTKHLGSKFPISKVIYAWKNTKYPPNLNNLTGPRERIGVLSGVRTRVNGAVFTNFILKTQPFSLHCTLKPKKYPEIGMSRSRQSDKASRSETWARLGITAMESQRFVYRRCFLPANPQMMRVCRNEMAVVYVFWQTRIYWT